MTVHEIRDLWKAQPFQPFTIHLVDGRSFPVPHPDFLFLAGIGRTLIVNSVTARSYNTVDIRLIVSLETLDAEADISDPESSQKP